LPCIVDGELHCRQVQVPVCPAGADKMPQHVLHCAVHPLGLSVRLREGGRGKLSAQAGQTGTCTCRQWSSPSTMHGKGRCAIRRSFSTSIGTPGFLVNLYMLGNVPRSARVANDFQAVLSRAKASLRAAQDRLKAYADQHRRAASFLVGEEEEEEE